MGNVRELRQYLDRRKLAVACECASELFATPLHVAVTFNRIEAVRYLGGRFPETLRQPDRLGRTPLHYAAMRADGQFAYHTLLTLGANKDLEDHVSLDRIEIKSNRVPSRRVFFLSPFPVSLFPLRLRYATTSTCIGLMANVVFFLSASYAPVALLCRLINWAVPLAPFVLRVNVK